MTYKIDAEVVLRAARGRWDEILYNLAPCLRKALEAVPRHVSCPLHGGENGFRFFKDYREAGNCICNTCGAFDGLHILMKANGWDFFTALKAVNGFLRMPESLCTDTEPEYTDGKVMQLGLVRTRKGEGFCLRLKLADGTGRSLWGTDLRRACTEAQLQPGDNIRVTRLGAKTFQWKGKEVRKVLWTVRKLAGDAQRREEMQKELAESQRRSEAIHSVWNHAAPVDFADASQKPLLTYLESRGILPSDEKVLVNMRFMQDAAYFDDDGQCRGKFPCMICAVRKRDGSIVTLHRTFLSRLGRKIGFGTPKKLMAVPAGQTINGASIGFGDVDKVGICCVAEGVETALSVRVATGYPCMSAISANGMMAVDLPEATKVVFIFADRDKSLTGQKAAVKLQSRLTDAGIPSVICLPNEATLEVKEKGSDWNDVIVQNGPAAFPFRKCEIPA